MFKKVSVTVLALAAGLFAFGDGGTVLSPSTAQAGCITGALLGGVAGHFLGHHGMAGAAAGCAGGYMMHRHHENQRYDNRGYNNNNYDRQNGQDGRYYPNN